MIGTDLNLTLPSTSDTYSVAITRTATALQAIEDSIAEQATPAALNITSNLSIGGNHLTNVGGVVLASGNSPASAGSLYYSGGNFYMRDATGIIQITAAGAINVAGVGGIGGDYGGANPATVTFDDLSGEYRFKEDASTWGDLVADDLVLMETGGTDFVRVAAPASLSASYTLTLPDAPPASPAYLQMDASGNVTANNELSRTTLIPAAAAHTTATAHTNINGNAWALGASVSKIVYPVVVEEGKTITGFTLKIEKTSDTNNTITATLSNSNGISTYSTVAGFTDSNAADNPGSVTLSVTGQSHAVLSGFQYAIVVTQSDSSPGGASYVVDSVGGATVTHT